MRGLCVCVFLEAGAGAETAARLGCDVAEVPMLVEDRCGLLSTL